MEERPREGLLLVSYARVRETSSKFSKAQFQGNQN